MRASLLVPATNGRVEFSYSTLQTAPNQSGCYALAVYDGTILYIGKSVNIHNRMEQHLDKGDKGEHTPWGVAYWLYYKICSAYDLDNLENGWINVYMVKNKGNLPFFNKIRPPT